MKYHLLAALAAIILFGCGPRKPLITSASLIDIYPELVDCYTVHGIEFKRHPETKNCPKEARIQKGIDKMLYIANEVKVFKDRDGNLFPKVEPEKHFPHTVVFTPGRLHTENVPYSLHGFMSHEHNLAAIWRGLGDWKVVNHEIWHHVIYKAGWVKEKKRVRDKITGEWKWIEVATGDNCHESKTWSVGDPFYEETRLRCPNAKKAKRFN